MRCASFLRGDKLANAGPNRETAVCLVVSQHDPTVQSVIPAQAGIRVVRPRIPGQARNDEISPSVRFNVTDRPGKHAPL